METKESLLKTVEDKKIKLNKLTDELLNLYRKILQDKIDYKEDSEYKKLTAEKRVSIKNLETDIREDEKKLKKSDIKKIEQRLKKYSKKINKA